MFKRKAIGIKEALQLLEAYAEIPIRMVEVGLKQAVQLSEKLNVYAYDAYLLACALNQRAPLLKTGRKSGHVSCNSRYWRRTHEILQLF